MAWLPRRRRRRQDGAHQVGLAGPGRPGSGDCSPRPACGFPSAVRGSGRREKSRRGARCRAAASPGRSARRPLRRLGRGRWEGGGGCARAEGAVGAALPCPWLCLLPVFSAGRRRSFVFAGGGRIHGGFVEITLPRGRGVFVTSCCVFPKTQEGIFSGCSGMPTFSEVDSSLINA